MKRCLLALLFAFAAAPAWADIIAHYDPGATIYARVFTGTSSSFAVALAEGTSNAVGRYRATDAAILSAAGTLAAGTYDFKIFLGTPSTSANDTQIGTGAIEWSGTAELTPSTTAANRILTAFELDGSVYRATLNFFDNMPAATISLEPEDLEELADAIAEAIGGSIFTDVDQEPVPTSRIFDLVAHASEGLIAESAKSLAVGSTPTFAVDFRASSPVNGRIATVDSVAIVTGTSGGITFDNFGRDRTQAKFRATAVTPGEYRVRVTVTYTSGAQDAGTIRFIVAE